jgi:hypothetical protein
MKKSDNLVLKFLICMGLAFLLLFGVGSAQASLMNWTETDFKPGGDADFAYDPTSNWEIVGEEVEVLATELPGPVPGEPYGTIYQFLIPNFYDPLPLKTIHVILYGGQGVTQPYQEARVLDIVGADSDYDKGGPADFYVGDRIKVLGQSYEYIPPTGGQAVEGWMIEEWWEIRPNVDREIVKIYVPEPFDLQGIQIVTQSIPIPQTILLLGSGLAVLLGVARRRMR